MRLQESFITTARQFEEGTVEVFEQPVNTANVQRAVLRITALGLYVAYLNGKRVGDVFLAPGFTYYPKDLHYQEYDVTGLMTGEDVLQVRLGQGWYCGRFGFRNKTKIFGDRPAVSWELIVTEGDGTERLFRSSDESVHSVPSPFAYAGLYDGEQYIASGNGRPLLQPIPFRGPLPDVIEPCGEHVRLREEMPVRSITKTGGKTILDFGQNFAGVITVDPSKMSSDKLLLRHGELLESDGSLHTENLRSAKAELSLDYTGADRALAPVYCPEFTYMGFRYAELSGCEYEEGLIRAYAVYSDMEPTGSFYCENEKMDRLFQNLVWGQKSNYVEVPTDCPQRDERMGYTGDGQVFAKTGAYNFDTLDFWKKFLKDIRYSQTDTKDGYVSPTVPPDPQEIRGFGGFHSVSMLGWGTCVCVVPEVLYRQFGDRSVVEEQYESMKAFVDGEIAHLKRGLVKDLWISVNLGDWLAYGHNPAALILKNNPVSNCFIADDLRIMAWAADLLGKPEEARRYREQREKTIKAYLKSFITKDGHIIGDDQGAYIMALKFIVPKGELWDKMFRILLKKIRKDGMRTGFFSTMHILQLLTDNGEERLAMDLLFSEKCPSWLYQVNAGATTIWERWDSLRPDGTVNISKMGASNMVSFNHYAYGCVGEFLYEYILGLKPLEPGFARAEVRPHPDKRFGCYTGTFQSRNGSFAIAVDPDQHVMKLTTPVPTLVALPDGSEQEVGPGNYNYSWRDET